MNSLNEDFISNIKDKVDKIKFNNECKMRKIPESVDVPEEIANELNDFCHFSSKILLIFINIY